MVAVRGVGGGYIIGGNPQQEDPSSAVFFSLSDIPPPTLKPCFSPFLPSSTPFLPLQIGLH